MKKAGSSVKLKQRVPIIITRITQNHYVTDTQKLDYDAKRPDILFSYLNFQ